MPPKRKQAKQQPPSTRPPKPRRSKLAKENSITHEEEAEIREAFHLFATDSKSPTIKDIEVRRCLIALDCAPSSKEEMRELVEIADANESGLVDYEHFLPIAALKLNQRRHGGGGRDGEEGGEVRKGGGRDAEVEKAFRLFTKGEERLITLQDLRRIAKDLREEVPEGVLRDMLMEATGGGLGGVGLEDFEGVMRRAGVFG
ncbi:EF-hand [Polychaeton citri CBS 116435]|uniref:Calmodulin n=1 Tax=Polychaeton citri CBS 116435 TaxID=1314669 RepID=A0A9P4Q050_9PEZI|nr:EF-hand [Polychaeton citri CBS 116435]